MGVEEEILGDADGPEFLEAPDGPARRTVREGRALVGRVAGLLFDRLVGLALPGDDGVGDPLAVALFEAEGVEQPDEVVLGEDAQRELGGFVLVLEGDLEPLARREAGVGVGVVEALRGRVDLVEVDGTDLGDDRQGQLEFGLRVGAEAPAVGRPRGHRQLEGIILHEPREEQRRQGDEHQDDDDDGTAATSHGVEAPARLSGRLMILVACSEPRRKTRWTRAGRRQVVEPGSASGSSTTDQVRRSAS